MSFVLLGSSVYAQGNDQAVAPLVETEEWSPPEELGNKPEDNKNYGELSESEDGSDPSKKAVERLYARIELKNPDMDVNRLSSLLFTAGQHSLILEAREGFLTRPPEGTAAQSATPPRGPREVTVGGIIYLSRGDWVVWINGQKISPKNLPPEILDIRVFKDSIKIKWYDAFTNQVFPIKIKAHQRFNIDTRIFLPG